MSAHTPGQWVLGNENNACCDVQAGPVAISLDRSDYHTGAIVAKAAVAKARGGVTP